MVCRARQPPACHTEAMSGGTRPRVPMLRPMAYWSSANGVMVFCVTCANGNDASVRWTSFMESAAKICQPLDQSAAR